MKETGGIVILIFSCVLIINPVSYAQVDIFNAEIPTEKSNALTAVEVENQSAKATEIANLKDKLKAYGKNKEVSAIPFILEALKNENADVRTSASWALANIADRTGFR